jgi:hypothetical protein
MTEFASSQTVPVWQSANSEVVTFGGYFKISSQFSHRINDPISWLDDINATKPNKLSLKRSDVFIPRRNRESN